MGLKLTKIHAIISFYQEPFIAPYIRLCTEARKNANNPFDKKIFKTAQVANFGYGIYFYSFLLVLNFKQ